jgi:uncharacterized protein YprB with RNaseH-like and TPR domain
MKHNRLWRMMSARLSNAMITESFIFLPGVQGRTEMRLWEQGISTWDHLLDAKSIPFVSAERLLFWKGRIRQAQALLERDGAQAFARLLGARHTWRIYDQIMENPRFVDIETSEYKNDVTVVGVSDGEFYQAFIKGRNLDSASLRRAFAGASCIITFNGSSFDLPILDRNFPSALPDVPHLDLRHICSQAGLYGGLKRIEKHLMISRPATIREKTGADAIMLWYRHVLGDEEALNELVDYNAADTLNLAPIAEQVIPALWRNLRHGESLPFRPLPREAEWFEGNEENE